MEIAPADLDDLRRAKRLLEKTSFAMRIANAIGKPVDAFLNALPPTLGDLALGAAHKALEKAMAAAVWSLGDRPRTYTIDVNKAAIGASGAIGGAFGMAALIPELTASTTLMLRSIAEIAQHEGESLASPETRLACLQVFALGAHAKKDDTVETGYFAVRTAMAATLDEAVQHVARRGMTREGAPVLVRFVSLVAARFGIPVSEKVVAQSVPIVGAVGGAAINLLFLTHFQDLARGHFIVRRLERKYGAEKVREAYAGTGDESPSDSGDRGIGSVHDRENVEIG